MNLGDFYVQRGCNNNAHTCITDCGPAPCVVRIEKLTEQNTNYRSTVWTGTYLQTTVMCLPVRGEIGLEVHPYTDQFIRIEQGCGVTQMGCARNRLTFQQAVTEGCAVFVPAGMWHNIVNTGSAPLKLYTIYGPPNHPRGTCQATKAIAEAQGTH